MNADYKRRFQKGRQTEKLARTFSKYALRKLGYSSIFLLSKKGFEPTGIVDGVGIKKSGDKTDIVLFQVKGNQRVPQSEIRRLRSVAKRTKIKYGIIEYRKGKLPRPIIFDSKPRSEVKEE